MVDSKKDHLGKVGQWIKIRAKLVTGHAAGDGALDFEDALGRNATLLPFRHGVRTDAEASGKFGLRDDLEYRHQRTVVHLVDYVHHKLSGVNHLLIAGMQPMRDHKPMVEIPKPELSHSFGAWLEAARTTAGLTKRQIAEIAGVSAQATTRWYKSKGVAPAPLEKLARWAGVEYAVLRMLLEEKPFPGGKKRTTEVRCPDAHRIARKLDLLATHPETLQDIEAMVDHHIAKLAKQRKRG